MQPVISHRELGSGRALDGIPGCREGFSGCARQLRGSVALRLAPAQAPRSGGGGWLPGLSAILGLPPARPLVLRDVPSVILVSVRLVRRCLPLLTSDCGWRSPRCSPVHRSGAGELLGKVELCLCVLQPGGRGGSVTGEAKGISAHRAYRINSGPPPAHGTRRLPRAALRVSPGSTLGRGRASGAP